MSNPIIRAENLSKTFHIYQKRFLKKKPISIPAVKNVSFQIFPGEIFGIVGESGCGKSTLGRLLIKLLQPSGGKIFIKNQDVTNLSGSKFRPFRKTIQMVFQNPYSSLNPGMTVGQLLEEAVEMNESEKAKNGSSRDAVLQLLSEVSLSPDILNRYPHQISGGEARRIGLARILAVKPQVIILDEPVASLDLSIKSSVIHLLLKLRREWNLTYIWISHDLEVINEVADRVMVMFGGQLAEIYRPGNHKVQHHPYAEILLKAAEKVSGPYLHWKTDFSLSKHLFENNGSGGNHSGCSYYELCQLAQNHSLRERCQTQIPQLIEYKEDNKWLACHFHENGKENHEE